MSLAISATVTEFSESMSQKAGMSSGNAEDSGQGMESSATSSCIHGIEVTGEDDDEEEENGLASNSRRGRSKALLWLEESDSDEEGNGSSSQVSAWKPEPTDFANDGTVAFSAGSNRKLRRVRNTMSDSDSESCLTLNSEREDQNQNESKGRRRSSRDGAKETVKQIKKKNYAKLLKKKEIKQNPNNSEEAVQISQNDSALPFADSDLFDREFSESEEDSVNAIKALVKNKVLKSKKQHLPAVTNDEDEKVIPQLNKDPPKRAERKAAKVSKAALQQIHSETQRLIRESNTSLPYHLPEPKSIHDFFKRRSHQPGNSGISSRYSKTQPNSLATDVNLSGDFHLVSSTEGTPDMPELSATPEANNESLGVQACVSIEVLEESGNFQEERNGNFTEAADQHSIEPSHGPLLAAVIEMPDKTGDECATSNDKTSTENVACSNTSNGGDEQVNVVSAVHSLLEKPKTLGVDFAVQPRISAPANNFIDLTEVPNTGMEKFQQRFLRHFVASANPPAGNGKQETSKLAGESSMENALTSGHASLREKPGAGRLLLKAKLREEMRKRRETERCRRWEAYNMETGKGFEENVEEEEKVPDLGEKYDRTNDSDLELDPESKTSKDEGMKEASFHFETAESLQHEDDLENLSMLPANEGHSRKIYPTTSEASLVLFEHTNSGSHIQSFEDSIRLGESGQEELCAESDEEHGYGHNSSFDLSSSTIPPYQPLACSQANLHFRSPSPSLVSPLSQYQIPCGSSVTMSSGKCSEIQLPVENSQDLYQMSLDPILGLGASQAGDLNFRFSLNEDMDSETCEPTTDRLVERFHMPNSKRKLNLESLEENAMDGNMDELLVLCSGSFPPPCDERDSKSAEVLPSKIMDISIDEGEGGMSELLELCSGKFPSQDSRGESRLWNSSTKMCDVAKVADTGQTDSKTSLHAETTRGAEEEEEEEWFQMTSDEEAFKINAKWKKGLHGGCEGNDLIVEGEVCEDEDDLDGGENNKEGNDLKKNLEDELVEKDEVEEEGEDEVEEEEDEDDVEDGEDKSDEEEEEEEEYYLKTRPPKELRLHNFVEEEAALSDIEGSVSEDEDEGEEDLYEEEENDEVLPSERKLQSQVKRLHMKAVMDDDKRQLRLYQERYLLDGDLHSDGAGRQRCFRWKNLNDLSQTELFRNDADLSGDDEQPHNHVEEEVKRIKERLDRELWKRKKSEEASEDDEEYDIAEDSQFMKMAKKYVNGNICKTDTSLSLTKKVESNPTVDGMLGIPLHLQFSSASTTRRVQLGSLLAQPKEELQRLAGVASNCELPPGTAHTNNRRSFVFQALSPDPKVEKREKVANKRSLTKPSSSPVTTTCVKRPRHEVPKQPRSVFSFL